MRFSDVRIIIAGALAAACLTACSRKEEASRTETREAKPVQTVRAEQRPMERVLAVAGSLAAREQANLSVKVAGRLKVLNVDIGSEVKKGDVIAQIEPRDYELRVQLAQAALAQARAALGLPLEGSNEEVKVEETATVQQARAVLDEATKARARIARLHSEKISSNAELDTAEAAYKVAQRRYEAALEDARVRQATLAQRQAELDLAQQQLSDTSVRAPFDGIIQARIANAGEFLAGGAQVVTLVQVNPLRLRLEIAERYASDIQPGLAVHVRAEGDAKKYAGRISRVSPAITEENRMLVIEGDVANPGHLRPGQFVRAEIVIDQKQPALAVPTNALTIFAGLEKLVLVDAEGKALEKNVKTGRRADGWIEIVNGLKEKDLVILNPGGLRTGQPVTVETNESASNTTAAEAAQ